MGSTKNVLKTWHAVRAESMGGNVTSPVTGVQFLDNLSVQLNFTGTPTGVFSVEVSNDYDQDSQGAIINLGNWIAIPLNPAPVAAGAADQIIIDLNQMPEPWMRVVYTRASGTGTLDMYISAKMV